MPNAFLNFSLTNVSSLALCSKLWTFNLLAWTIVRKQENWLYNHVDRYISGFSDVADGCPVAAYSRFFSRLILDADVIRFSIQLLLYRGTFGGACCKFLHVCFFFQFLAKCWELKRNQSTVWKTVHTHLSWGLLYKWHTRVCRFLFPWFKPVVRIVSFLWLSFFLPNLRWAPFPFLSLRGLLHFPLRIQNLCLAQQLFPVLATFFFLCSF